MLSLILCAAISGVCGWFLRSYGRLKRIERQFVAAIMSMLGFCLGFMPAVLISNYGKNTHTLTKWELVETVEIVATRHDGTRPIFLVGVDSGHTHLTWEATLRSAIGSLVELRVWGKDPATVLIGDCAGKAPCVRIGCHKVDKASLLYWWSADSITTVAPKLSFEFLVPADGWITPKPWSPPATQP